jgi:hypothetical protein
MMKTLTGSQFACLFKSKQLAWLLGAGASASAGIPTGYAMIQDFKKQLFCQQSGISPREVDSNDPLWIERINHFFCVHAILPPPNDPSEYAAAFEAVYPSKEFRRSYIEEAIRKGTPSFAHRVLASLLTAKLLPCVFTTNFDPLVENSTTVADQLMPAEQQAHMTVAAIDNVDRAELCLKESRWPLLAKLHGDFQSVELKNTEEELRRQDGKMRRVLTTVCSRFGLVIVGYSGRDDSVMQALTDALAQQNAFPGGIFWVTQSSQSIFPSVTEFLMKAIKAGVSTTIVESPTFDELAGDIIEVVDLPSVLLKHVQVARPESVLKDMPLPVQEKRKFPILQCSAIPVLSMPMEARRIAIDGMLDTVQARKLIRNAEVRALAASNGRDVVAFGADEDLLKAFSSVNGKLNGTIKLYPEKDSWAQGLIYDALTRAVSRCEPLRPRFRNKGHSIIVANGRSSDSKEYIEWRNARISKLKNAYSSPLNGKVPGCNYPFNEGVQLQLERVENRWWCAFEPFTDIEFPRFEHKEDSPNDSTTTSLQRNSSVEDWRRERWVRRYNATWANLLSAWAGILTGEDGGVVRSFGLREGVGVDAVFHLASVTAWSRPSHEHDYFLRGGR